MPGKKTVLCARLHNNVLMPAVSLGTYKLAKGIEGSAESIKAALTLGYRGLDTAWVYENEDLVGEVVRKFEKSKEPITGEQMAVRPTKYFEAVTEEEYYSNFSAPHSKENCSGRRVFVTSKVWTSFFDSAESVKKCAEEHLKNMGRQTGDLLLLHWPGPHSHFNADFTEKRPGEFAEKRKAVLWKAMEELYHSGQFRAIGVSNYMVKHLKPLLEDIKDRQKAGDEKATIPMYNQFEISPFLPVDPELERLCRDNKIAIASYSTLGSRHAAEKMTKTEVLQKLAKKHNKDPAAVALRWALDMGCLVCPKSSKPERVKMNYQLFDFELSSEDLKAMASMATGERHCPNPLEVP